MNKYKVIAVVITLVSLFVIGALFMVKSPTSARDSILRFDRLEERVREMENRLAMAGIMQPGGQLVDPSFFRSDLPGNEIGLFGRWKVNTQTFTSSAFTIVEFTDETVNSTQDWVWSIDDPGAFYLQNPVPRGSTRFYEFNVWISGPEPGVTGEIHLQVVVYDKDGNQTDNFSLIRIEPGSGGDWQALTGIISWPMDAGEHRINLKLQQNSGGDKKILVRFTIKPVRR